MKYKAFEYSVFMPFVLQLDVSSFPRKKQIGIMEVVASYLLGLIKYSDAIAKLRPFKVHLEFQSVLKQLSAHPIKYSRTKLRRSARGENVPIHAFDDYWLDILQIPTEKIRVVKYPTESEVFCSMSRVLGKKAWSLVSTTPIYQNDRMMSYNDIFQDLALKVAMSYRLYIFGFKTVLDEKAFYSCLQQSMNSHSIDLMRTAQTHKRNGGKPLYSLSSTWDNEDGSVAVLSEILSEDESLRGIFPRCTWCPSPEDILSAKEELYYAPISNWDRIYLHSLLED